ncbi:MAG: ABC transporter permease [Chloroflexi bacterium]|nr:ABC transporter permease [Chloroflexota bacterium]
MGIFVIRRLVELVPTLILVSILTFTLVRLVPGDPIDVMYGLEGADKETRAAMEKTLGLDQPVVLQYVLWAGRMVSGDLGFSYRARVPVATLIGQRLPNTLMLVFASLVIAVMIAIPLGVLAAIRRNTLYDFGAMATALVTLSVPPFASGIALVLVFGLMLGWLPTMGAAPPGSGVMGTLRHMTLPAVTLAMGLLGVTMRLARSTVLEELGLDYVRTARAKGLAERWVIYRHVLRNSLLTVVTFVGLQASYLVGGAVVIEVVFAWPGVGSLVIDAILARDYPVVQAVILLVAVLVMVVSTIVDLTYPLIDPRVQLT